MKRNWSSLRIPFFGGIANILVLSSAPVLALPFVAQTTFVGAGDDVGSGVAANGGSVYFTGQDSAGRGVIGQYGSSLNPSPIWGRRWPGPANDPSDFGGVALTSTGVIAAGWSHYQTVDTVGDKERKGITVKFNADGSAGGGVGGAVWTRQTPAAPGGFAYGGIEWLTGVTTVSEGGQARIEVAPFVWTENVL